MFWYCFREREQILDLFEMVCGRAHAHALLPGRRPRRGHPARLLPGGAQVRRLDAARGRRLRGAGQPQQDLARADAGPRAPLARTTRSRSASRARCCARPASTGTCGASQPYLSYAECDFDVPVYQEGDVYARYRVHMEEMRESTRIVAQCLDRLEGMEGEPWIADDRKVVLPPREELHTSMESLIHHFKIVTEGYRVPEGEIYVAVESPRGELGCYVVSDGGPRPWRVKFRAPSFVALQATATLHDRRADRGHDRDRRLARHGDGRGRPVTAAARTTGSRRCARAFPEGARSAMIPALRLAQEEYGWLSPEALRRGRRRARPDAGLLPRGRVLLRHVPPRAGRASTWSRSARTSRARSYGAQHVVEAFEDELGVPRRRDDRRRRGHVPRRRVPRRLRLRAPSSRVDHRYRARRASPRTCRRSSRRCAVPR